MCAFSIEFKNKIFESEGDKVAEGEIKIGSFNERFQSSLSYWDEHRYRSQWHEALSRFLLGEKSTALVTTMYDPGTANFIFWWIIYLVDGKVHMQNHVLILEELKQRFDEKNIYACIPDREICTEDGEKISEWVIAFDDIERCLQKWEG